jgi:hypothetical protein
MVKQIATKKAAAVVALGCGVAVAIEFDWWSGLSAGGASERRDPLASGMHVLLVACCAVQACCTWIVEEASQM